MKTIFHIFLITLSAVFAFKVSSSISFAILYALIILFFALIIMKNYKFALLKLMSLPILGRWAFIETNGFSNISNNGWIVLVSVLILSLLLMYFFLKENFNQGFDLSNINDKSL